MPDAPYYNGEPGAMAYDDERRHRSRREPATDPLICFDCGVEDTGGFAFVGTTGHAFCSACGQRRQQYPADLFDPRPWSVISQARAKGAA